MRKMGTNVVRIVVYRVLCTSQENSRPKTFRKNAKKAENAKKTYFYNVKKRKITHADAEKRRKIEQNTFVPIFRIFSHLHVWFFAFLHYKSNVFLHF